MDCVTVKRIVLLLKELCYCERGCVTVKRDLGAVKGKEMKVFVSTFFNNNFIFL